MLIRQERKEDYKEVYELIREAFASAEHADGNEQDLTEALRKGNAFIPELSLVAEIDGKLAGHILFTKANIGRKGSPGIGPAVGKAAVPEAGRGNSPDGRGP